MSTYPPGTYQVTVTGHWTDRLASARLEINVTATEPTTADEIREGAARQVAQALADFEIDTVTLAD